MPRTWETYLQLFIFCCFAALGLVYWRESLWYALLPIGVWIFFMLRMHFFIKCPSCSRRLHVRKLPEPKDALRYLYDCPDCKITWDSQYVELPSEPDSP